MGFLLAALPAVAAAGSAAAGASAAAGSTAAILSGVGMAASAIGGVTGAIGAERSASATAAEANYQAEVAAQNQTLAQRNADLATATGEAQAEQSGLRTKAQVGAIRAAEGASNVDVNSGSALDVQSSASELGMLDALNIRSNASRVAYGYETQGANFAGQKGLYKAEAANAPAAGALGAASSLLGGAAGVASQYQAWQRAAGSGSGTPSPKGSDAPLLPASANEPVPPLF